MRSKGAALALTLPGVGNRLLAAATYATHDPALGEQKMETAEMETAKCDVFRATFFARAPRSDTSSRLGHGLGFRLIRGNLKLATPQIERASLLALLGLGDFSEGRENRVPGGRESDLLVRSLFVWLRGVRAPLALPIVLI
jgi:hypothetical protein